MSEYRVLCGHLHLSRTAFDAAQGERLRMTATAYSDTGEESESEYAPTVRELFSAPETDDDWFNELNQKWTLNEYDSEHGVWHFSVPLHDDLWADLQRRGQLPGKLLALMQSLKADDATDALLLLWHPAERIDQAFVVTRAGAQPLAIPELDADAAMQVATGALSAGLAAFARSMNPRPVARPPAVKPKPKPKKKAVKKKAAKKKPAAKPKKKGRPTGRGAPSRRR